MREEIKKARLKKKVLKQYPQARPELSANGVQIMSNGILKAVDSESMRTQLRGAKLNKLEETKLNLWKRFVESL
jgi:hypothetical protein